MVGRAFVTYVRADDESDGGRIVRLVHDIASEYAAITADQLDVVLDRDHLHWGDDWREGLTDAVTRANFLIVIVTPRFFLSAECRRELELFQRTATALGRRELILPILYIDVPDLAEESDDPLRSDVARFQRADFRDVRFEDIDSSAYRRRVHEFAVELRDRSTSLSDLETPVATTAGMTVSISAEEDLDRPGYIEMLADGHDGPVEMAAAMSAIGEGVKEVGELVTAATARFSRTADPRATVANRVLVSGDLAAKLEPVVDRVEQEAARYRSAVDRSSGVVEATFGMVAVAENKAEAIRLARTLIDLSASINIAFESGSQFVESLRGIENFSKSLRRPIVRLRQSIQSVSDTGPLITAWADDARAFLQKHEPGGGELNQPE